MKKIVSILIFCIFLLSITVTKIEGNTDKDIVDNKFLNETSKINKFIPVIVEFREKPYVEYNDLSKITSQESENTNYSKILINTQDVFLNWMKQKGINYKFKYHCTSVINAVSMEIAGKDISLILNYSGIRKIYDDRIEFKPSRYNASISTGSINITKKGISTGKGILVGIIDTGIDDTHPDLKGKVKGGYNFADDNEDLKDKYGHGTHVAGIIAGNGTADYKKGIAYDSELMIYKIISDEDEHIADLIPAIDQAVKDGCKVINIALEKSSSMVSSGDTIYHRAINNAIKAGSIIVTGAGNLGSRNEENLWPLNILGSVENSITVAGSDDRNYQIINIESPDYAKKSILSKIGTFTNRFTNELSGIDLINCGYGSDEDFVDKNIKGNIALIQRGQTLTFRNKVENAQHEGARAVIIYDNIANELISPTIYNSGENPYLNKLIPVLFVTKQAGEILISLIDKGLKLSFNLNDGDYISSFTSMGPTIDGCFKPEISAPGTNILSTVNMNYPKQFIGGYAQASGTTVSASVVSGIVALIKENHPDWSLNDIKSAIMNTSEIIKNPFNNKPVTFLLQGAGEIRADKAINTSLIIEPRAFISIKKNKEINFIIKNISDKDLDLPLSYEIFGEYKSDTSPFVFKEYGGTIDAISINKKSTLELKTLILFDYASFQSNRLEGIIKIGEYHIPFVIYKDEIWKTEEPITNFSIEPSKFSINYADNLKAIVKFNLNTVNFNLNYAIINLKVCKLDDTEIASIVRFSEYSVGNYEFVWDGKDEQGRYFLRKGKYFLKIRLIGYTNCTLIQDYYIQKIPFEILNSTINENLSIIISAPKKVPVDKDFVVDINARDFKNLNKIHLELYFDSDKMEFLRFYNFNNFNLSISYEEKYSLIYIDISKFKDSINIKKGKLFSLIFKGKYPTETELDSYDSYCTDKENNDIRILSSNPKISILSDGFLLADLNDDNKVDETDYDLFILSYGTSYGEEHYDPECDFNQDLIIDSQDLIVLSKEMGKEI